MKIHKQPKKVGPIHPEVGTLITNILTTPKEDLPSLLSGTQTWEYPRCDLHAWSAALNKFDELLEEVIKDYEVDKLQVNDFTPSAKSLVGEILRFERLLLDNSTNRKIYASYDRLNALLNTTDLDILVLTLKLFLRPAQQYSSQASLSQSLAISTSRLATLCMRFPGLRDHGLELAALVSTGDAASSVEFPPGDVQFNFYRLEGGKTNGAGGMNVVTINGLAKDPRPAADVVAEAIETHGVPEEDRFELLHRVRLARALGTTPDRVAEREKLAIVRLLSVAIFCHTHHESTAQNSIFLPDPLLVSTLAECLAPGVPAAVQNAAVSALDGIARYRGRLTEVTTSVNAGVSHGVLMSTLRRVVHALESPEVGKDIGGLGLDGVEQLLGFVTYLASNAQGGSMIVGAGLIPLLVQIIENKHNVVLPIIQKTMSLVDNVLYGYTNAFAIWLNANGISSLVQRIKFEIDQGIEDAKGDGEPDDMPGSLYGRLPHFRSTALKNLLRSMHRMMQSSGTSEGLRNLIDSSLSKSAKSIIEHRGLFGPNIFALSINIMATFVHNEPTCLGVLQEQHVPETFYNAVELGIEPSLEVIQAIPNAIGALCLNQAGQEMLAARPTIIPAWFSVFTSEKHVRVLQDRENAAAVGSGVDELMRHHPILKASVMESIKAVFAKIEEVGNDLEVKDEWGGIYHLRLAADADARGKGKSKQPGTPRPIPPRSESQQGDALDQFIAEIGDSDQRKSDFGDNPVIVYIEVLGRFLEGLFQHAAHCREFLTKADGVERLCKLYALPCLPYDFPNSSAAESIVGVLRIMCEVGPTVTLMKIHEQMRQSLEATRAFWSTMGDISKLESFASITSQNDLAESDKLFRSLITLAGRLSLMSDVYASIGYSHGRGATTYLQALNSGDDPDFLEDLGALHRSCIWENLLLKAAWPKVKESIDVSASAATATTSSDSLSMSVDETAEDNAQRVEAKSDEAHATTIPSDLNRKAVRHLIGQIPMALTTFFQAVVKMFLYSRRTVDPTQKKQALATAAIVARTIVKHLRWKPSDSPGLSGNVPYITYGTVMLGLVTILFFDERTSQNNLQTMLLVQFREAGGLSTVVDMCQAWFDEASRMLSETEGSVINTGALIRFFGGIKVALNLFEALIAAKPLFDSGQTALLTTRDKKAGDKDYFEPHDFLIKLRHDILPFLVQLWNAPWIVERQKEGFPSPPLGVVKSILRLMQHIMEADGEERKVDPPPNPLATGWMGGLLGGGGARLEVVADETRVQQIMDMGFPRHAAERALRRTGNHVAAAAEYLLSNPAALLPEPEPVAVPAEAASAANEANQQAEAAPHADVTMDDAAETTLSSTPGLDGPATDGATAENISGTHAEQRQMPDLKADLDAQRALLQNGIPRRCLLIVDAHESLIFDVKGFFVNKNEQYSQFAFQAIVDDITTAPSKDLSGRDQLLSTRCHLLALVLNQSSATFSSAVTDAAPVLLNALLALSNSNSSDFDVVEKLPKWLSPTLLAIEAILTSARDYQEIQVAKDDDPIPERKLYAGPDVQEAYETLFPICWQLLGHRDLPRDELIAVLRLLVLLTRERKYAEKLLDLDGLPRLLERFQNPTQEQFGCQIYLVLILRHLVEDKTVLGQAMKDAIVDWFHQPRNRVVDAPIFVKSVYMVALRDPDLFLDTAASVCQLTNLNAVGGGHHVCLQPPAKTKSSAATGATSMDDDGRLDDYASLSSSLEAVMQYLVNELLRMGRPQMTTDMVVDQRVSPTASPKVAAGAVKANEQPDKTLLRDSPEHVYLCELMSWLTELVTSYGACKIAFVNHGRKRIGKEVQGTPAKQRPSILNFLIQDLLFAGSLNPKPSSDHAYQLRAEIGIWSMSVLTALCRDEFPAQDGKDLSSDLVSVRKSVLDAISKAVKEASLFENSEAKYDKLHAIADLCHHLLSVRPGTPTKLDEASVHMAKLMLEKNFVSLLTGCLAEIDLNYPHIKTLVNALLRPLEQLTRVAIKMGRATEKERESDKALPAVPTMSAMEQSASSPREETPDLYRNSSLGMFGGEMDEMAYEDEGPDEDEEELEEEGMEVDFEDDDTEDTGMNTEDDEEEEDEEEEAVDEEDMEVGTEGSEEHWDNEGHEEEVDEEDGSGSDESEDEDAPEHPEQIMWEENEDGLGNAEDAEGEELDEDVSIPVPLLDDEALPGEDDDGSDVADFDVVEEIGMLQPQLILQDPEGGAGRRAGWRPALNAGDMVPMDGFPAFFPPMRRSGRSSDTLEDDPFGMGRPRSNRDNILAPHPLLLDPSVARHTHAGPSRPPARRGLRNATAADHIALPLLAALENLGDAFNVLGQILNRGRGGEAIELELAAPLGSLGGSHRDGAGVRHHSARRQLASHAAVALGQRPDRQRSLLDEDDFGATSSIHRWQEEAALAQGQNALDKAGKLANHLINNLLPVAREAAARARAEEAEAEAAADEEHRPSLDVVGQAEDPLARQDVTSLPMPDAENTESSNTQRVSEDVEMTDEEPASPADIVAPPAEAAAPSAEEPGSSHEAAVAETDEVNEGQTEGAETAAAGPSTSRVTVLVHGQPVDITDTGIDPTFLEALPDDMREEVLNQHFREHRPVPPEELPQGSTISAEFLDALPADIRAEILLQESAEQRRIARVTAAASGQGAAGPVAVDMDPATFFATLDPQLRSVVLLEQDDALLQGLPSSILAEANDLRAMHRELLHRPRGPDVRGGVPGSRHAELSIHKKPGRDAIQLLDKTGIATLVRLLFYPQLLRKNYLHKILVNICENSKTRAELISLLLNILQDGTGDLAAVDKAFAQLSVRPSKAQATPRSATKQKASGHDNPAVIFSSLPPIPGENIANLIAQRSIEALAFIVNANDQAALFFLTEQDVPLGLKRALSKREKGKGKEKQSSSTKYPIVVLLGLLDRPALLSTATLMDSVSSLLATVTRSLSSLEGKAAVEGSANNEEPPRDPQLVGAPPVSGSTAQNNPTVPVLEGPSQPKSTEETQPSLTQPPQVPHHVLRLVVNILTVGECSGKAFQQTLALISHLSILPDARDVIAAELKARAQTLGGSLYVDLDELVNVLEDPGASEDDQNVKIAKFSPASSEQAKLLRILKTIDYMYLPKKQRPSAQAAPVDQSGITAGSSDKPEEADAEKVSAIYEGFRFTPLWKRLGDCLSIVEDKPELEHVATVLLPLIESLMVVCKHVGPRPGSTASRLLRGSTSPLSPATSRETIEDLFVTFTDQHRKMLNVMVRNNPSLMSGSFSLLVQNPRVLDFDNKRNYFNQQLHKRPHSRDLHQTLQLNVRRARVFEDSFQYLQRKTGDQIKYGKLSVRFYDEEGVDAGGVTREWYQILARQMFNPNYVLFEPCAADRLTYQPNRASSINPEHLLFFKFVGRIIGKAIYDGRLLDAHFARSFYRQLLGKPVDYKDVEWIDPEYYNSLCWILENDPTPLDLMFSVEADEFGVMKNIPLKPGGDKISVTNENKREYVQLAAQNRLVTSIKDQVDHLLLGFFEIIPKDLITIFNEQEVELLISGTPEIDVDEWRAATDYNGYTPSDHMIVWWWRALKSFSREERAKMLAFVTGTSRVPLDGFNALQGVQGVQRFSIHRAYGEPDRLPQAHTCFNQIDLPEFTSYEKLRTQLLLAINEGGEGFGFA